MRMVRIELHLAMIDAELITKIGNRRVIVDACVSREIANSLRYRGLIVRHVVDINAKLTDLEIAALMYADEVLVTRDCGFYKILGKERAILLSSKSDRTGVDTNSAAKYKREMQKKRKLPPHIRIALRQKLAEEAKNGILYTKILWCIWWLSLPIS
jgi:uncharacterized protein with PIN domain